MRKCFLFIFLIFCFHTYAQNVSGLYSGTLYNDTTRQTQQYELALSEYRGKITGYAYATFILNDTFYYSIRRVKGTKKEGHLIVEDVAMLAHNLPGKPNKGVRRITQIPINHLSEADTLQDFNATWRTTATKQYYSLPGVMALQRRNDSSGSVLLAHLTELRLLPSAHTIASKDKKENAAQNEKGPFSAPVPYTQRQQKLLQTFEIGSDSLVLSFYDNGVVDGDVISVYVNGQNIISHSKLLAVATRKTVRLNDFNTDTIELVLVAETLGDIPPNTGLLVVQDGANRYEVRFSADLQTNAALHFKKKK